MIFHDEKNRQLITIHSTITHNVYQTSSIFTQYTNDQHLRRFPRKVSRKSSQQLADSFFELIGRFPGNLQKMYPKISLGRDETFLGLFIEFEKKYSRRWLCIWMVLPHLLQCMPHRFPQNPKNDASLSIDCTD